MRSWHPQHFAVVPDRSSWTYSAVDPQQASHAFQRAGAHPPLWLALDQVVDPQNLGAIIRTAAFFRADGVVVCARNRCAQCVRCRGRQCAGLTLVAAWRATVCWVAQCPAVRDGQPRQRRGARVHADPHRTQHDAVPVGASGAHMRRFESAQLLKGAAHVQVSAVPSQGSSHNGWTVVGTSVTQSAAVPAHTYRFQSGPHILVLGTLVQQIRRGRVLALTSFSSPRPTLFRARLQATRATASGRWSSACATTLSSSARSGRRPRSMSAPWIH